MSNYKRAYIDNINLLEEITSLIKSNPACFLSLIKNAEFSIYGWLWATSDKRFSIEICIPFDYPKSPPIGYKLDNATTQKLSTFRSPTSSSLKLFVEEFKTFLLKTDLSTHF